MQYLENQECLYHFTKRRQTPFAVPSAGEGPNREKWKLGYHNGIEDCQREFTRIIEGMVLLRYPQRLQRLRLTTLLERRMRGDLTEIFKIMSGFVDYGQNMFRKNSAYQTRNLPVILHHSLRSAHDFFSNRVIKNWNQLPLGVQKFRNYQRNLIQMVSGNHRNKSLIELETKVNT